MKAGIYFLNKDTIEEEFSKFSYVPENYWEDIQFDEAPFYIIRRKTKRKGVSVYMYDVKKAFLLGYVDGWKLYVDIENASVFEKAFRPLKGEEEWLKKLHAILESKR